MKFEYVTTQEKVSTYLGSYEVFSGLIKEMRELSKKKSEATLSKGKVKVLNRVLEDLKSFLNDEPEGKYLDLLDDDELPQNSDAVLTMVQYEGALVAFKGRYYRAYHSTLGHDVWITEEIAERYGT